MKIRCGLCGMVGHNRRTCGRGRERFEKPIGIGSGRGKILLSTRGRDKVINKKFFLQSKKRKIRGSGLLDTIKLVKDFIFGLSDKAKKAFQASANLYRSKFCDKNRARSLYLGEMHPLCENFTGPGTRLDLKDVRDTKPYDNIDRCSETHDYEYEQYFKIKDDAERRKKIRASDLKALRCYDLYKNEPAYKYAYTGISGKIYLEDKFPFIAKKLLGVYYGGK